MILFLYLFRSSLITNPSRCLSCDHAPKCPYDAKRLYLDPVVTRGSEHWPISAIVDVVGMEIVRRGGKIYIYISVLVRKA